MYTYMIIRMTDGKYTSHIGAQDNETNAVMHQVRGVNLAARALKIAYRAEVVKTVFAVKRFFFNSVEKRDPLVALTLSLRQQDGCAATVVPIFYSVNHEYVADTRVILIAEHKRVTLSTNHCL